MEAEYMDANEMRLLVALGEERAGVKVIHEGVKERTLLVPRGAGQPAEVLTVRLDPKRRQHEITTLESFVSFLASAHAETENGVVFVGRTSVVADMGYRERGEHTVQMPLEFAEEYMALLKLAGKEGWTQKALWRLLATELSGCIEQALMLSVGGLTMKVKDESEIRIDNSGLTSAGGSAGVSVSFRDPLGKGELTSVLPEWITWRGRIFECFEREFTVELRLELDLQDGRLFFLFHPRRMETALREARLALVSELAASVPATYTVHEGTL